MGAASLLASHRDREREMEVSGSSPCAVKRRSVYRFSACVQRTSARSIRLCRRHTSHAWVRRRGGAPRRTDSVRCPVDQ